MGLSIPVLVFDSKSRRIVAANDASAALFKTTSRTMVGDFVDAFLIPEERPRLVSCIGTFESRWGDAGRWRCQARDGNHFIARVRFHQEMHDGRLVHVILATEIVHMEKARAAEARSGNSSTRHT